MKIGILFPGYGSQFVGMAKELYDHSRVIQEYFEVASHCLELNFVKLCFASSDMELSKLNNAYPALFLVSTAVAEYLKELGVQAHYVAGYGIGEYGAVSFGGGLSFADGLYLLKKLAEFYLNIRQTLDVKSVIIDGLSSRKLKQICGDNTSDEGSAQISIYEGEKEHLVSGHTDAVDAVAQQASDEGANKIKKSENEDALHTPILSALSDQLRMYLNKVDFKDLDIPLITGLSGKEVIKAKKAQDSIMGQIIKPVYWLSVLRQFAQVEIILVVAPAKSLCQEIRALYPDKIILGIDCMADIKAMLEIIKPEGKSEKVSQKAFISDIMEEGLEHHSV